MSTQDTLTSPGTASAKISIDNIPFAAEQFQISTHDGETLFAALDKNSPNVIGFFLTDTVVPGPYEIGEDKDVRAFFYYTFENYPKHLVAKAGDITIISIDPAAHTLEASFELITEGQKPGDPDVHVTEGKLKL